jgi:hypothetical protein
MKMAIKSTGETFEKGHFTELFYAAQYHLAGYILTFTPLYEDKLPPGFYIVLNGSTFMYTLHINLFISVSKLCII